MIDQEAPELEESWSNLDLFLLASTIDDDAPPFSDRSMGRFHG